MARNEPAPRSCCQPFIWSIFPLLEQAGSRMQNALYRCARFSHCDFTRQTPGEAMRATHIAEQMKWSAGCVQLPAKQNASPQVVAEFISRGRRGSTALINKDPTFSADIEASWEEIYCLLSGLIYKHLQHLDPISLCSLLHWSLRSHIVTCIKWKLVSCFPGENVSFSALCFQIWELSFSTAVASRLGPECTSQNH